jgi:hypothetical protein
MRRRGGAPPSIAPADDGGETPLRGARGELPEGWGTWRNSAHVGGGTAGRSALLSPGGDDGGAHPSSSSSTSRASVSGVASSSSSSAPQRPASAAPLSFGSFVASELGWGTALPWRRRRSPSSQHVINFLHVPLRLEPLLSFGHAMCVDLFLHQVTALPLRCAGAVLALVRALVVLPLERLAGVTAAAGGRGGGSRRRGGSSGGGGFRLSDVLPGTFTRAHAYDLLKGLVIVCAVLLLGWVQVSRVYHYIRGEAIIKLYVIFNILEIFDKLACSLGTDVMDALYRTARDHLQLPAFLTGEDAGGGKGGKGGGRRGSSGAGGGEDDDTDAGGASSSGVAARASVPAGTAALRLAFHFSVAVAYTVAHSLILFVQIVCLNVAINSKNNALLTLMISNNFVELKSSVFRRFEAENLFQVTCADAVERFQLALFLTLIAFHELSSLTTILPSILAIFACEVAVDYVKHSFISKFNRLHADLYSTFKAILAHDLVAVRGRMQTSLDPTHTCVKRLGLATLPLTVVVYRMVLLRLDPDTLPRLDSPYGLLAAALLVACFLAAKALLGMMLLAHAARTTLAQREAQQQAAAAAAAAARGMGTGAGAAGGGGAGTAEEEMGGGGGPDGEPTSPVGGAGALPLSALGTAGAAAGTGVVGRGSGLAFVPGGGGLAPSGSLEGEGESSPAPVSTPSLIDMLSKTNRYSMRTGRVPL